MGLVCRVRRIDWIIPVKIINSGMKKKKFVLELAGIAWIIFETVLKVFSTVVWKTREILCVICEKSRDQQINNRKDWKSKVLMQGLKRVESKKVERVNVWK